MNAHLQNAGRVGGSDKKRQRTAALQNLRNFEWLNSARSVLKCDSALPLSFPVPSVAAALFLALSFLTGCSFAPKYSRPSLQTPAAFKELTPQQSKDTAGWKTAEPKDDAIRGKWWEIFADR